MVRDITDEWVVVQKVSSLLGYVDFVQLVVAEITGFFVNLSYLTNFTISTSISDIIITILIAAEIASFP